MKFLDKLIALLALVAMFPVGAQTTSNQSGYWNDTNTWVGGTVPTSGDVIIATGHEVIYNANHNTNDAITISSLDVQGTGTLVFPFSDDADLDANFTLTVTGTVDVAATAAINNSEPNGGSIPGTAADRTHLFNFEGNITNAGTIDFSGTTTSRFVDADFQDNSFGISGAGNINFYDLDIEGDPIDITITSTGTITIENTIDLFADSELIMNGTQLDVGVNDVDRSFELAGNNSTFTLTSGIVNIGTGMTTNNRSAFWVDSDNSTLNVDGGTLNIGNDDSTGEGAFRIDDNASTGFTFDIDGGTTIIGDRILFQGTGALCNLNISAGTLQVGTGDQGGEAASEFEGGTLTMTGGTLEFGENLNLDVLPALSGGAAFSVGTNANLDTDFQLDFGNWTLNNANFTADGGLDILASNSITVEANATLAIESEDTDEPNNCLQVFGTLTIDGGTVNVAGSALTTIDADIIQIEDGGVIAVDDGTLNIATAVTDGSQNTANFIQFDETTSTMTVGDATGAAGSAVVNIGTSIVAQNPPTEEDLILINGNNSSLTINSDGEVNVGGGNVGSVLLNTDDNDTDANDFHLVVQGGTLNINGALDFRSGTGFQMTSGTTNIGVSSSDGINDLDFTNGATRDVTAPTTFEMTGGTLNVGDGAMRVVIGDEDDNPTFGSTTAFIEFEITGGIANINGGLRLRDYNSRLILGGGATINFDAQAANNFNEDADILFLEAGIVQVTGAVNVNFIDPHSIAGTGEALFISGLGSAANDAITSSSGGAVAVDFSNVTWGFGDGSSSVTSVDGFDLSINTGHSAYGNWVINNPDGSNREVSFVTTGNSYVVGDVTITAGTLDLSDNNFDDSGSDDTFTISSGGTLKLNTDFPGHASSNFSAYTLSSGSTVDYNGAGVIANGHVPDGTAFSNLTVSGGGTINLAGTATANDTVFLTSGTLAASSNLTLAANAVVSRSSGSLTGTLQGSNPYTIRYTGSSASIDPGSAPEWSGSGVTDLVIDLDAAQTLTINATALAVDDLSILTGTLTDAALTHTISGDLTANGSYTGTGSLSLTGGSASHSLTSSGTAVISNLTMNDVNGASGDLSINITNGLTLTNGILNVGSGTFTMSSGASITGGSSSTYVAFNGSSAVGGMVQTYTSSTDTRTYPIGTSSEYTPGTMTLNSSTGFGTLTMKPVTGGSQFTLDGSNTLDLDFHWILTDDGSFSGVDADYSFTYDQSDVRGVESSYVAARYDVSNPDWTNSDDTSDGTDGVDDSGNEITLNGVDFTDGHFTAGELDEFSGVITTYYLISGVSDHDWDNGTHWTNTDGGSTPINRTPGTNSPVIIKGDDVTVDSDSQNAGSITIESDGIMIIDENGSSSPSSGHTFGTVSGTGTLRLISEDSDSPVFPDENGGNWSSFVGSSGGTVVYTGDGSYTIPTTGGTYHNLTVTSSSAASTKTLPNEDLTVSGNFAVNGGFGTTASLSDAANGNLTVSGTGTIASGDVLAFGSTNNRTVSITGDVTVEGTFNVSNSGTATHNLNLSGSLTSNGTFDMNTGGSTVATTFNSSSNESISGTGTVDFDRLIVNVGSSTSTTLTANISTMTVTDAGDNVSESSIEFQNGELILATGGTIVLSNNGNVSIPATSGLHLSSGAPTVSLSTSTAGNLTLNGTLQVTSGILNVGDVTDQSTRNDLFYDGTSAAITVDGGTVNVGGGLRPSVTDGSAALNFTLSSGTVSLARNKSTNNISVNSTVTRSEGDFVLDNASAEFNMTGGTLEIVRAEQADGKAISIGSSVTTYNVTAGTVRVLRNAHDAFSSNTTGTGNDVMLYSSVPFYNLEIGDGDYEGDVGGPNASGSTVQDLRVLNNLVINLNDATADNGKFEFYRTDRASTQNEDEFNIEVGGNFTLTDGTIQVADGGDGGTITFNGSGTQVFTSNGETFGDITINSTGTVQLADALTISGDWTHTQGTLDQNSQGITMNNGLSLATTINGSPSFDDLTLSNTNGITQTSGTTTITSSGTLTISDDVIYDLGDNGLVIANQSGGITFSATADATNMIRVSGSDLATGVTLTYPNSTTSGFIFPVGATINATDYYLPGQIDLTAGGGAGATANMILITSQHPQITDAENALNLYWSVIPSGFNGSQTATHTYTYGAVNADLVEGADDTNFLDAVNAGSPTFNWTEGSTVNVSGQVITFTDPGSDNIAGDFTAGVDAAFNPVTVFYTIRNGDWNNTATTTTPWTNDECAAGVRNEVTGVEPSSSDPVVICSGDVVTITTTTGLSASGVEINGTLNSDVDNITTINDISGTGTLAFDHTTATTPSYGSFASSFLTGGTVDFGGTMAYTLPTNTNYHNLSFTNTSTITLANNVSVTGDVTLSNGSLTMGTFTITDGDANGTFTAAASTDMTIDGANNFPASFNTYSLNASSTVTYSFNNAGQTIAGGITYGNLTLVRTGGDPATRTLGGNITIAGDLDIDRRSELAASTFDIDIQGNWIMDTRNNTNFDPGTGTVTFSGSGNQTVSFTNGSEAEAFYDLTLNKSGGTLTFPTNVTDVTVQNDLTVTNGTLEMDDVELVVTGNTSTAGGTSLTSNATIDFNGDFTNAGTFTVPNTVTLAGNFNNTGTYTSTSNTLTFDNTGTAQSLTGVTTFNNLTIAKASGVDVTFNNAVTVDGTLALQNEGNIVLATGNLTISDGAAITGNGGGTTVSDFSATRMIRTDGSGSAPTVIKNADNSDTDWDLVFPVGVDDGGNKYTPVTVAATNDEIATTGTLSVRSVNGTSTDQSISGSATTLNRHFDFDITGIGGAVTFDIIFGYDDGDVQGSEGDYNSAYSERSVDDGWNQPVASVTNVNAGNNQFGASASLNGTINFSAAINTEWIAGDNDLLFPRHYSRAGGGVDCSGGCDWNDPTHWTLTDGGTTSAGSIPTTDNAATISSGHTMTMDNNSNNAQSVNLIGTLDIAGTNSHSLGEITGTGTLQIDASGLGSYVNTGSGSTFFSQSGGTTEYLGDAAYTLPTAISEYNNLTIGGTTQNTHDKTVGVNTTVFGNLTLGATDLENASDLNLELRGSFTSSGGDFNVQDGTFIFANTATASLPSDLSFGSAGNLTLDNFGEKDLSGALVIENLTINSSSGTFDANSNTISVTGNWDNQASTNLLSNPGTLTFNGGDAQQIDGDNTFAAVNISTTSTNVTIGSGTQSLTGALTLATGTTFNLGSNTLRAGGTVDVDQGTFNSSSARIVYTSTTDPEVQTDPITVATLEIDKGASTNTFDNDPATVTFTDLVLTSGEYDGADLNVTGNLSIASGAALDLTGITTMDVNGDFTVAGTLNLSGLTSMNLASNFINNGTFSAPTTVTFDGTTAQTISGSSTSTFGILAMSNTTSGNTDLTLNSNVAISNYLDFQVGIIVPGTGTLTFNDNATVRYDGVAETTPTGGSNDGNSFVAGPVSKIGDDDFVFPIGDGSRYARLGIQPQTGSVTDQYTGQYLFSVSATATGTKTGDIVRVSGLEHWDLTRDNGTTSVIPTLFYDGTSEVDSPIRLRVAHYTGTEWEDLGNGAFTSSTVTASTAMTSFSDLTLGTSTQNTNPLPVEMLYFDASVEETSVNLEWATAKEINNDYFEIQRSLDGVSYRELGQVRGAGSTSNLQSYQFIDDYPVSGVQYYRLKQVDFDGAFEFSDIVIVEFVPNGNTFRASLFPNPMIKKELTVEVRTNDLTSPVNVSVMDLGGRVLLRKNFEISLMSQRMILDVASLQSGTYLIQIRQRDRVIIAKRAVMLR